MNKKLSINFLINLLMVLTLIGFMISNVATRAGLAAMPDEALFQGSEEPPSETPDPDTHDIEVHLFTRQELLHLQKGKAKTVKLWADVSSFSSHTGEDDNVEVKLEFVSQAATCNVDQTVETKTASVRPGGRKLVSFDRAIWCTAAGENFTGATFKVTAKHLPPGDDTATSEYAIKVTVK